MMMDSGSDALWGDFDEGKVAASSPTIPITSESLIDSIESICRTNGVVDIASHLEAIVDGFSGGYPSNFIESCKRKIIELRGGTYE
ncbi:MAG TPA: hypothetical protein VLF90_00665 [Patescibacteria group bacterium]|nr:hypothetical protein [Patescibacteria group bacterium]